MMRSHGARSQSSTGLTLLALVILLLLLLPLAGCEDGSPTSLDDAPLFELQVSGETFQVAVTDPDEVTALEARMQSGVEGAVSGELVAGDGGINTPWSWHLDPTTVHVPDVTTEVCDGRPSMVEGALEYWLGTVGRFCPWGAVVVRRMR